MNCTAIGLRWSVGMVAVYVLSQFVIPNYAPRAEDVQSKTKESEEAKKEPCMQLFASLLVVCILLVCVFVSLCRSDQGVYRLAKDPQVWLITIMYLLATGLLSCLDPIFPIWFEKKFHVNATITGLAFVVATGAYAITNPLVIWLGPKVGRPACTIYF